MASIFDEWTIEDAKIAVKLPPDEAKDLESYVKFVKGDHWQGWAGWIGPVPDPKDIDAKEVSAAIEKGFVSRNAIGEGIGRHVNGVLGRNVKWSVVPAREMAQGEQPTGDEKTLIDEITPLLKKWVAARKLNQEYDKAGQTLLVAGSAFERPFVPPGEIGQDGTIPQGDLATSINRVYIHFPKPGEATIYTDPRTQAKCSVYYYRQMNGSRPSQTKNQQREERAELTYLDGEQTVVRVLGPGNPGDDGGPLRYTFGLGSRLLMADLNRKPLVNPQVVSQQKLLNLALTMKERNVILGGFLERVAINAQMNGNFETQPDGRKVFVPSELPVGAGAMTSLVGYVTQDEDGKQSITTPSMLWREPVDVKTFLDTEDSSYRHIMAEMNQLHYAASSDSGISAESRLVSMAAYLIDLLQTKQQIDAAWSWLLEMVMALAAILSGQPGRYDMLRVSAECSVDPGPISVEMMQAAMQLTGGKPLLSVKTAQGWIGVEDTDGESQQMAKETEEAAATDNQNEAAVRALLGDNQPLGNDQPPGANGNSAAES